MRREHVNYTAKRPNRGNADRFLTEKIYQSKMFELV